MATQLDPLSISADLLYAVKTEGNADWLQEQLATLERSRLARALTDCDGRLAFWLNCYNAYGQLLIEDDPSLLEGGLLDRWKFYARDRIPISGVWLSLNDIQHGLLRGSKLPWGFGYLPRPIPSAFERRFRLEECDPRIHFALSRGSENCPPIAVYSPATVDDELDIAVEWYLEESAEYDPDRGVATIPPLFRRYRGDFGGKRGIVDFLREYDAIPADATPSLAYESVGPSSGVDLELE
ncbi:DUF547 domain-containing protein [Natrarchaeobius oligotrophus]|uniref:DUF547 domain-containing protein n=1 Tax=Natrarchaeobius chitinivorans TaxID=1679083 RepID=A0A3N6M5J4_NATCH|nr:DUF547 domain-containing protein [Natrarchaeobius chitinivorans]RQG98848.1 DUF547 domain-containing protein [Natrarchaeobius chitinivorans]